MKICVFGASSKIIESVYLEAGLELGRSMALSDHQLIFGGGDTGMMGAVARGVAEYGGHITGIAPTFFDRPGVLFKKCTEFKFTETMWERKNLMAESSDAFIITPGGIGTLEEFFEVFTLKQLGRHKKPIGILNVNGYFDQLIQLLEGTVEKGFMAAGCMDLLLVDRDPQSLLDKVAAEAENVKSDRK